MFWSWQPTILVTRLVLASALVIGAERCAIAQVPPVEVRGATYLNYRPKLGDSCATSAGSFYLETRDGRSIKTRLRVIEGPNPYKITSVSLASYEAGSSSYACLTTTQSDRYCETDYFVLSMTNWSQRRLLFDMASGEAEMSIQRESGPPCRYSLSPEDTIVGLLRAEVALSGRNAATRAKFEGTLSISYAAHGCSDQIEASWVLRSSPQATELPSELWLESGGYLCKYFLSSPSKLSLRPAVEQKMPVNPHSKPHGTATLQKLVLSSKGVVVAPVGNSK